MASVGDVTGVREAIAVLRTIDADLARESVRNVKAAAEPARSDLAATAPRAPLSGMARQSGPVRVTTNYGGRKREDGTRPLVRIRLRAPGWTVSSDMARTATPGETMVDNLTRRWGGASRWAWPTMERHESAAVAAVARAAQIVQQQATAALKGRL